MASQPATFVAEMTGTRLDTAASYTIDPAVTNCNIENFTGTAQVPIGIAGPLTMVGEHARGDFYIPQACRMFGRATAGSVKPAYLSLDNDPLFEFHRWKANLRILEVEEIKTVPYVPLSHPFVERLIGTIRREFLDQVPCWHARDLKRKLHSFKEYYNRERTHQGLEAQIPEPKSCVVTKTAAHSDEPHWKSCCRGLYQLPVAA